MIPSYRTALEQAREALRPLALAQQVNPYGILAEYAQNASTAFATINAALASQAVAPVAAHIPFNANAKCSPTLTQCPRCNNPHNACDTGAAVVGEALTDDEIRRELVQRVGGGGMLKKGSHTYDIWFAAARFAEQSHGIVAAPSPEPMLNGLTEPEQSAFERWLAETCPSGDVTDVHRQWLFSSAHENWYDAQQSAATASVAGLTPQAVAASHLISHSETVSSPGAAMKVEAVHLTDAGRACLTAGVDSIGEAVAVTQAVAEAELPPLPEPLLEGVDWELWGQNVQTDCYTADQMRAYALAAQKLAVPAWQPMHDAPRDRSFLASVGGLVRIVRYGKTSHVPMFGWILVDQGPEDCDLCEPDGWMEMPAAAPTLKGEQDA